MQTAVPGLSECLQWSTVNLNTIHPGHFADNTTRVTWGWLGGAAREIARVIYIYILFLF
jgi:hypothetical protein